MIQKRIDHKTLTLLGFSSVIVKDPKVTVGRIRGLFPKCEVQAVRADLIAGPEHLIFAVENAMRAFRQGYNKSRSLAMEILLYASCQRQISKAIEMLGINTGIDQVAVVVLQESRSPPQGLVDRVGQALGGKVDLKVLEIGSKRKLTRLRKVFEIHERELEASRMHGEAVEDTVKRLVVERSALLALEG